MRQTTLLICGTVVMGLVLAIVTSLIYLTPTQLKKSPDNYRESQIVEIREVIVRSQLKSGTPNYVYFISFANEDAAKEIDPPDDFLKRFSDLKLRIKKSSQSRRNPDAGDSVIDPETGDNGIILSQGKIEWISDDEVSVGTSWYAANLGAGGQNLTLKKKQGKWVVEKTVDTWIS